MATIHDIKTWYCSGLASKEATNIGGSVPVGKTRFITFLSVYKDAQLLATVAKTATGAYVQVGSVATAAGTAVAVEAGIKIGVNIPGFDVLSTSPAGLVDEYRRVNVPEEPNFDHPIFKVRGRSWVCAVNRTNGTEHITNGAAVVQMFAQYYDE